MPQTRPIYHIRFWLQNSFPFLIIVAFDLVLENTDIIMLGHFMQPDDVATYYATVRTSGLIGFIAFAVSALVTPQSSSGYKIMTVRQVLSALLKEHPKDVKALKLMGNLQFVIGNEALGL